MNNINAAITLFGATLAMLAGPALASPISYKCTYPTYSDKTGKHTQKELFTLQFVVDVENEKAYAIGNQGAEPLDYIIQADGSISLIEVTGTGNVMTTAVDTKGNSVHSRNTVMFGELLASQWYGTCVKK